MLDSRCFYNCGVFLSESTPSQGLVCGIGSRDAYSGPLGLLGDWIVGRLGHLAILVVG
jgi:hypothetical protein